MNQTQSVSDEEGFREMKRMAQQPCIACGTIPAGGAYHNNTPACIDCYVSGRLADVLTAHATRLDGLNVIETNE